MNTVKGDLNSNAGGWGLWLYYTKQEYGTTKRAVSDITFNGTYSGSVNCYNLDGSLKQEEINMNRGCSGADDIYMHLTTTTKTNRPSNDPVKNNNLVYNGSAQNLITINNSNTGTMMYCVGSGSYSSSIPTATNAATYIVYYYAASNDYGNTSSTHSTSVTIAKAPNSGVTVSCADIVEGSSNAPDPQLGGTNLSTGAAVSYTYCTTQNGSYSSTVPTEPGTYYVKATVAGDDNYNEFTTEAASFKIIRDWALHSTGNSEDNPYVISTTDELDLLAQRVNSSTDYSGKFFKLANDITYSHTTDWNAGTENNFTPIGNSKNTFKGTFDGNGKTISGFRVYTNNHIQGLFGNIKNATVKNVIVSDARIIGDYSIGGIAGLCDNSTITNCWVKNDVSLGAGDQTGGIVGEVKSNSTISGCRSEATLRQFISGRRDFGGIVGHVYTSGAVSHCVVVGASIPNASYRGAVLGSYYTACTLTNNYYTACTVAGVANATNVGCNGADANGARQPFAIGAATDVTITPVGTETVYDVSGITAYEGNNGIIYGGQLYAGAGETVTFNIEYTAPEYFALNGFTDGNGNALADNGDGTYTLTMTGAAATITPDLIDLWGITAGRDGSTAAKAYRITTTAGLDLLASKVNINTDNQYEYRYEGVYFELGDDIVYDGTTNNYTPIGNKYKHFCGHFDGKGHTISGININRYNEILMALFGNIARGAEIKNLTLDNTYIKGWSSCGGIVGQCASSTISNCHVTSTVTIDGYESWSDTHGGIAGMVMNDNGLVSGCTSSANVIKSGPSAYDGGKIDYGGIVGEMQYRSVIKDCLVYGGSINGYNHVGAVAGRVLNEVVLINNYHTLSGMGGLDGSDTDGARYAVVTSSKPSFFDDVTATYGEGDYIGIKAYGTNGLEYNGQYYYFVANLVEIEDAANNNTTITDNNGMTRNVVLQGRTLYMDEDWNTICLPFNVTISGSPLAGATVMELDVDGYYDSDNNRYTEAGEGRKRTGVDGSSLNLYFQPVTTTLVAGIPYIIKWAGDGTTNITNPVFTDVPISNVTHNAEFPGGSFKGTYNAQTFDIEDKSILFLAADNTLYWPDGGATIGAQRAYFQLNNGANVREFKLSFGDDTDATGVSEKVIVNSDKFATATGWYTLDGRRLNGKPTKKGMYIYNGKKIFIK